MSLRIKKSLQVTYQQDRKIMSFYHWTRCVANPFSSVVYKCTTLGYPDKSLADQVRIVNNKCNMQKFENFHPKSFYKYQYLLKKNGLKTKLRQIE